MLKGFCIIQGGTPWYQSGDMSDLPINPAPVGKGKSEKKAPTKNRASAKGPTEVLYPIFNSAAELTVDSFWKAILQEMAVGKMPRGFRYVNGVLTYKLRTKTTEKAIDQVSPQQAMTDAITFIQNQAGILSQADKEMKELAMKEQLAAMAEIEINSWSQIRSAPQRNMLIRQYVRQVSRIMQLGPGPSGKLEGLIRLGILVGYFNSSTIHVHKGFIQSVDGLAQKPDGTFVIDPNFTFKLKKPTKTKRSQREQSDDLTSTADTSSSANVEGELELDSATSNVSFLKQWMKFLNSLQKRSARHASLPIPIPTSGAPPTPLPHSI